MYGNISIKDIMEMGNGKNFALFYLRFALLFPPIQREKTNFKVILNLREKIVGKLFFRSPSNYISIRISLNEKFDEIINYFFFPN